MSKSPEIINSLDGPVYAWERVHATSDLSYLLVKRQKVTKALKAKLEQAWEDIYNDYIKEFGFSDTFIAMKKKEIAIALMRLEMIETGDRSIQNFIDIDQDDLDEEKKRNTKADFMQSKIAIESKFKFQINMHTTSIREFYSYLKHLK